MDFDFAAVKRDTQTLTSDAAKHRISVKPKSRKSSVVQSRRVADVRKYCIMYSEFF